MREGIFALSFAAIAAGISTTALTQLAFAADQPPPPLYKAPLYKAPPPVVFYSWTGFYVGGNVGYSWGNANTDLTANGNFTSVPGCRGCGSSPAIPGSFASSVS